MTAPRHYRHFTPEEDAHLRCHYGNRPCEEIARDLGRHLESIYMRAKRLGLCDARGAHRKRMAKLREWRKRISLYPFIRARTDKPLPESRRALAIKPKKLVSFYDLQNHQCRFPYGEVGEEGFGFCGQRVEAGQVYCSAHRKICFMRAIEEEAA